MDSTIDLKSIKSPADIKGMDLSQLANLSDELRAALLRKLSAHGGHVGPNLGVIEATVALHYVFDAPTDKIVFDVSHQSYVHKMLTGRIEAFLDPEDYDKVTGYTCPRESEYDLFEVGHTSTSISLANGLAKARNLRGGKENVVAFIGDASLGGGMALEALDNAPELGSNIIVILNDNQMSIAENHGALYRHLTSLRESNGCAENNIFKALGYEYIYVRNGNDLGELIEAYRTAKDADHAVLIHINTMKGMGFAPAEAQKEKFHYSAPFDIESGEFLSVSETETYNRLFTNHMLSRMKADRSVVTLTAGTPSAFGFTPAHRKEAGQQFIDTGICEQDAATTAAGLAKGGAKPVFGVVSTFVQRAYDQILHDVAINNLPVTIVDFACGIYGIPDITHLGFFDVPMLSNIPNIEMLAPATAEEYLAMIDYAIDIAGHPVVVRTPGGAVRHSNRRVNTDFSKYDIVEHGAGVAIIGAGTFLTIAIETAGILKERGINPTVINPRIISAVDTGVLDNLKDYDSVITLEDNILSGGFGEKVAAYLGTSSVKVITLGLKKEFLDRYNADEVLKDNGLTPEQIAALV